MFSISTALKTRGNAKQQFLDYQVSIEIYKYNKIMKKLRKIVQNCALECSWQHGSTSLAFVSRICMLNLNVLLYE